MPVPSPEIRATHCWISPAGEQFTVGKMQHKYEAPKLCRQFKIPIKDDTGDTLYDAIQSLIAHSWIQVSGAFGWYTFAKPRAKITNAQIEVLKKITEGLAAQYGTKVSEPFRKDWEGTVTQ